MSGDPAELLRARAESVAATLGPLALSRAGVHFNAASGGHGLRRAGNGEDFWQYRPAQTQDSAHSIDWRRSARGDASFVRDRERQTARTAAIWISQGSGMEYAGQTGGESKIGRAQLIALSLALSAIRASERVSLLGSVAGQGSAQASRLAHQIAALRAAGDAPAAPDPGLARVGQVALLFGDFLRDDDSLPAFLNACSGCGAGGAVLQILHPDEQDFPFEGAVRFVSPGAAHDTRAAGGLRSAYIARLAERRGQLARQCDHAGFIFGIHDLSRPVSEPVIWLHSVLSAK